MKFQKRIAVWAAVLMIMGTVTGCAAKTGGQNQEVAAVILHTNDVHAVYDEIMDQKVGELAFDMLVRDESGEPLDLQAEYTVTTSAFIQGGDDGYGMLKEADVLRNMATPDNEVVMQYIRENLGGVIPDEYREPQGRIVIKE